LESYDIDMEYNKDGSHPKQIECHCNNPKEEARPDLIIHKRWFNNVNIEDAFNLLIVEFKYRSNDDKHDYCKLKYFTNPDKQYKYHLGVLVKLGTTFETVKYIFFQNGNELIGEPQDKKLLIVDDRPV